MSIAKNLAAYLPAIIDQSVAQRPIGTAIAASELESYASAIYAKASRLSQPRDPLAYGKNLYTSLLNTIDRLISHRGCGTGITRTMWLHLKNIVMIHGDARDWSNHETGPILGALNATIAPIGRRIIAPPHGCQPSKRVLSRPVPRVAVRNSPRNPMSPRAGMRNSRRARPWPWSCTTWHPPPSGAGA